MLQALARQVLMFQDKMLVAKLALLKPVQERRR
jgi:hypothetical protein